ncbi:hypothetical protein G8770_05770 [Aestuariicella hydrocarbonica]|uniref:Uncharacterized protein n=1 Tax=Pseudomaricurvus hydrocarbonicus TaxID=1470433 RepID=A0A9E5MK86_9GAMM|nr:hypothetical protein [Aestuariicella hydrocarbonica]NHO65047.1 hypothetical protein [Aestuariicella hydrocarbonica]
MSVGAWDPTQSDNSAAFDIDPAILEKFIALGSAEPINNLNTQISAEDKAQQAPLMRQPKDTWIATAESLTNDQIVHLVRFFTLAEMQISGWEAGAESPVIGLVKALRLRKAPPSKELLMWIKEHSDNRFLPNGAL